MAFVKNGTVQTNTFIDPITAEVMDAIERQTMLRMPITSEMIRSAVLGGITKAINPPAPEKKSEPEDLHAFDKPKRGKVVRRYLDDDSDEDEDEADDDDSDIPLPVDRRREIYLNVPYEEKSEVKRLGARWSCARKKWYVDRRFVPSAKLLKLVKWMDKEDREDLLAEANFEACYGGGGGGGASSRVWRKS